ncbi:MAG: hypothetical protein GY950_11535 [bacterium]|nr:hypothetical protein [bacterium]
MMFRRKKFSDRVMKVAGVLFSLIFLYGIGHAAVGESSFKYKGFVSGEAANATARFSYMKRINIWHLSLSTFDKTTRERVSVNIFFSRKFNPKSGTFPIAFSYLNKPGTCGGSFSFKKGNKRGRFSHDTKGEITFETFKEKAKGSFRMDVFDRDGKKIEVSGSFELEMGDAFKK